MEEINNWSFLPPPYKGRKDETQKHTKIETYTAKT
jgi:hypothetical protein